MEHKYTEEEYVRNPTRCPVCGSKEITTGYTDYDLTLAWTSVRCEEESCRAYWTEYWTLTGVGNIYDGEGNIVPVKAQETNHG